MSLLPLILDADFPARAGLLALAAGLAVCVLAAALGRSYLPRLRLRGKIMFGMLFVSLAPMALLAYLDLRATYRTLLVSTRHAMYGAAAQTAASVDTFLSTTLDAVRTEALLPELARLLLLPPEARLGSPEEAAAMGVLASLKRKDEIYISSYALMDTTGFVAADTFGSDVGLVKGDRGYFLTTLETEMPFASDITVSLRTGEPSLFFCSPVRGPAGRVAGVLRVRYKATVLQRIIFQQNERLGPGSYALLLDHRLERLADGAYPQNTLAATPGAAAAPTRPPSLPELKAASERGDLFAMPGRGPASSPAIAATAPLRGKPWSVVFTMPAGEFLAGVAGQLLTATLLLGLIAVGAAASSLFIASRIARPIARLASDARRLARGDFTVRAAADAPDEIGMLAEDFNNMTGALRWRMDLETLLSDLSRSFVHVALPELDASLDQALDRLGSFLEVDRAYILLLESGRDAVHVREWQAPGAAPRRAPACGESPGNCPWFWERAHNLEDIVVKTVAELPAAARAEQEAWTREGVKSLLCVPLAPGGRLAGLLGGETLRQRREWRPEELRLVHLAGEILGNSVERLRNEEMLRRAHEDLERKVEERTRELTAANRLLLEMDQIKSAFLSSASHELRTPLTSVLGFAKLIRRSFVRHFQPLVEADPSLAERAATLTENLLIIEKEGERLTRLVNDLLDLNKIESGRLEWRDLRTPPRDLLGAAFDAAKGQGLSRPGVEFRLELAPDLPEVLVDRDRITQVVLNLLDNAAKFTPAGRITLRAGRNADGWLAVRVEDTGQGVPAEDLERIFDKFYQAPAADIDSGKPRGTGLGLAICRQIVEHYSGRIWAESTPDRGSVFSLVLPPAPAAG